MREKLRGGGYYVWQTHKCARGSVEKFCQMARAARLGHVSFKVQDGSRARSRDLDFVKRAKSRLDQQGTQIAFWGYYYAGDPIAAADRAVGLCMEYGVKIYIQNAEKEMKGKIGSTERQELQRKAAQFMERFRSREGGAGLTLGLSTFALRRLHRRFVYLAYLKGMEPHDMDFVQPQCYGSRPVDQCEEAIRDLGQWGEDVFPTCRAYLGDGIASLPTVLGQLRKLYERFARESTLAWDFWSWQHAEAVPQLWTHVANLNRDLEVPEAPQPSSELRMLQQENAALKGQIADLKTRADGIGIGIEIARNSAENLEGMLAARAQQLRSISGA